MVLTIEVLEYPVYPFDLVEILSLSAAVIVPAILAFYLCRYLKRRFL